MKKKYLLILIFASFFICCTEDGSKKSIVPEIGPLAEKAMVSSAHPLATKVGVNILKSGGNAVDAAIAIQFALAVVLPRAGNIGGGGFAVIRLADGSSDALDFREKAPIKGSRNMFLDQNGEIIPDLSTLGHKAAGVPGTVDGMFKLHKKYASKPMQELIQPAIRLAYYGHVLTEYASSLLNEYNEIFKQVNGDEFFISQKEWKAGDTIKYQELATTLTFIRDYGRDGFYGGIVSDQIIKEMDRGGGLITLEDLQNYRSVWRKPLMGHYRGHKVITMPPPSSGGVAIIQLLKGAQNYDIKKLGHNTSQTIHLMTELERRVYADRATFLGDPDFFDVPVDTLISDEYVKSRFEDISLKKKTNSQNIKEGKVDIIESIETTHFSVVDEQGNAVAITTTLNGYFGCKVMVKGAGFFLNNEMDDFSSKPGVPNMFGLVGGEANAIQPEKRMLSSMTPTIIEKEGKLKMVVGTPGGATIITSVFQTIMNVIDHNMTMQDAVNAKKTHSQWLPDIILVEENAINLAAATKLEKMGHILEYREKIGRMDCILITDNDQLEGGPDYQRGDSYAEGF